MPLEQALRLFWVKAHYACATHPEQVCERIKKELIDLLQQQKCGYAYDDVPEITQVDADDIREACFAQVATALQKVQLTRYYFDLRFEPEAPTDVRAQAWVDNDLFFFDRLKAQFQAPPGTTVFQRLAAENGWEGLFPPEDMQEAKMSPELRDAVFEQYTFKHLTRSSGAKKIVAEVYNQHFGGAFITCKADASKHAKYSVKPVCREREQYARQYMILPPAPTASLPERLAAR